MLAKKITGGLAAAAAIALLPAAHAENLILNGDFSSGTFANWTTYATAGGGLSWSATKDPIGVVDFDVDGDGNLSQAGRFRPGQVGTYQSGLWAGGGITQSFASDAGAFSLDMDLAFYRDSSATSSGTSGGRYQIFLDGTLLGTWSLASVSTGATVRNSFSYDGTLTAGTHELKIEMTRQYLTGSTPATSTPFQFVDNVVLDAPAAPVPEASQLAMLLTGLGLIAGVTRRRLR
ncbi:hypothetical protein [Viridibacterium curvum]|uniref:PEP-CTERM sorting domain-containing protein n=1 Tax=Viridibacterium curvum TaxID=1101404 RepID=A0ABP9QMU6_9RHOO